MRTFKAVLFSLCLLSWTGAAFSQGQPPTGAPNAMADPLTWSEAQRAFWQDGPGLLLTREQRAEFLGLEGAGRERFIQEFLDRDPIPETPANELRDGIARRQRLAALEFLSPLEVRSQLLFLNGPPAKREPIDCGIVFEPTEIWTYHQGADREGKPVERQLVVFKPSKVEPWKLWLPADSKRALYTAQMEYWLEQWEELRSRYQARRFDLQNCEEAKDVDEATGVQGLTGALASKGVAWIKPKDASGFLAPPRDAAALAAWARAAAATQIPNEPPKLDVASLELFFPERDQQRMVARAYVGVKSAGLKPSPEGRKDLRVVVDGLLETDGRPFEDFRMRFEITPPAEASDVVALAVDRPLRPGTSWVMRLKVKDEVSGAETTLARSFRVPETPTGDAPLASLQGAALARGRTLAPEATSGRDSLILLPPAGDVILGVWRAETIVTGERIKKVVFLVDGAKQLTRGAPPYSAEVRLAHFPTEQIVRVEGYDAESKLVAADEVVVNQPRGALGVWITEPPKGSKVAASKALVKAEVSVPDGRRIETVEFKVNDQVVTSLGKPPWQHQVTLPGEEIVYVTVVATLDDGSRAEAVRFLRAPQYFEEVDVNLIELYVAVTDRAGNLATGLTAADFQILEKEKPQEIAKFELVQNLPLTVGMVLDTSGSMRSSMVEAQEAAAGFLKSVITPKDKSFAVTFSSRPRLEMPPTDDEEAVVRALSGLQAVGDTALHDALVHSLYYFRGMQGQRALVLLSDGDDNASYISYKDALEYARRSGVAIYVIGFNVGALDTVLRSKLSELAAETGGRAFYTSKEEELPALYEQIEQELRSRYLLAYSSTEPPGAGGYRQVEVRVKRKDLKARAARGVY